MDQMQAIVFRRYGGPEVLEQATVLRPAIAPDQVLVRVVAAGVNPADWRFRNGDFRRAIRLKLPFVPGSDIAGVVEAVGSEVKNFARGDAVYAMLPTARGGGYAQYAAVAARDLAHMPPIGFAEAAAVPLAALTALQALRDQAALQPDARALIYGASGGVGSFALQIAQALGAHVTAAASTRNLDLIRSLGADEVIDYTAGDVTAGHPRYDVVFDTVNAYSFGRWRRVLRPNGTFVTVNPLIGRITPGWLARFRGGRRIKSIFVQPNGRDLETLAQWVAHGQMRVLIDRSYPLAAAADAHSYSQSLRVRGKLVMVVDDQLAATWVNDHAAVTV